MPSNFKRPIQFIDSSYPGAASSPESRRRANSHSARVAHANARRQSIHEYRRIKNTDQSMKDGQPLTPREQSSEIAGASLSTGDKAYREFGLTLNPKGPLVSYRGATFLNFPRQLKPAEHILFDHYMTATVPYLSVFCNKIKDPTAFQELVIHQWVRLALSEASFLDAILLQACHHMSMLHRENIYSLQRMQYKIACVRALNEAITANSSNFNDSNIAMAVMLAIDELLAGEVPTFKQHIHGAVKMMRLNGGPQTLGLDGLLEYLLRVSLGNVELMDQQQPQHLQHTLLASF